MISFDSNDFWPKIGDIFFQNGVVGRTNLEYPTYSGTQYSCCIICTKFSISVVYTAVACRLTPDTYFFIQPDALAGSRRAQKK